MAAALSLPPAPLPDADVAQLVIALGTRRHFPVPPSRSPLPGPGAEVRLLALLRGCSHREAARCVEELALVVALHMAAAQNRGARRHHELAEGDRPADGLGRRARRVGARGRPARGADHVDGRIECPEE